jgi:hypothetical protein
MKINIIILVSLINTLIMIGTELSAQEEISWEEVAWEEITSAEETVWDEEEIWKEEVYEEEVFPDLENELEFTEENTISEANTVSSESGLDEKETAISEENEDKVIEIVPIGAEPSKSSTTVSQEPNITDGTQASKIELSPVTESFSEEEILPELASDKIPTTITNQELNSNQFNNLSEAIPVLENTADDHNEILPSITYDPPVILNHPATVPEESPPPQESPPSVQAITTEKTAIPAEELIQAATVQSIDSECNNPATYFNDIREAHLPAVEIPLYIDINGQSISSIGLFAVKLRIPFGFADFELEEAVFTEILLNSSPCNAKFIPETGILTIPQVEIPTLITVTGSTAQPQVGPIIKCRAVLQQSNIRILVLSLKELQCDSPLPEPVQTDIN